jgi:uncharacterized protein YxeA
MKKMILTALAAKNMKTILMGAVAVLFLAGTSVAAVAAVPGSAKPRTAKHVKQENKDQKKPDTKPQTKSNKTGKRVTKTNKTVKSGPQSTTKKTEVK